MRAKIEKYAERQNFDRAARTCDTHFEFIELDTKSLRKSKGSL